MLKRFNSRVISCSQIPIFINQMYFPSEEYLENPFAYSANEKKKNSDRFVD
jgi:hypothetical protein